MRVKSRSGQGLALVQSVRVESVLRPVREVIFQPNFKGWKRQPALQVLDYGHGELEAIPCLKIDGATLQQILDKDSEIRWCDQRNQVRHLVGPVRLIA